jgi:putative membrane protein
MKLLINWLLNGLAVVVSAYILPGVTVNGYLAALAAAVILSVINTLIRPILTFLTLPLTIITFGLFTFVINAVLILLTASVVPGFRVENFFWALIFSLVLSVVSATLHRLSK